MTEVDALRARAEQLAVDLFGDEPTSGDMALILAAFEDVIGPLREIAGQVVLAPCSCCRSDWPHFSVLSTSPVCESCRRAELAAERRAREAAEQALEQLHGQIMNIPAKPENGLVEAPPRDYFVGYLLGHKDARHAAAELVSSVFAATRPPGHNPSCDGVIGGVCVCGYADRQAGHTRPPGAPTP